MPNTVLAFRTLSDLLRGRHMWLVLTTEASIPDREWEAYAGAIDRVFKESRRKPDDIPTLVLTDGGRPNSMQRAAITEIYSRAGGGPPVATLTDSLAVRGILRALTWMNPRFRVFAPRDFDAALRYLDVPTEKAGAIKGELLSLERELGGAKLKVVRSVLARDPPVKHT